MDNIDSKDSIDGQDARLILFRQAPEFGRGDSIIYSMGRVLR